MNLPNDLIEMINVADRSGAAVMLLDASNRIYYTNNRLKDIYSIIDFSQPQTYENFFKNIMEHHLLDDPSAYDNPSDWLGRALHFKRTVPFAQYLIRHNSGKIYMTRHQILQDLGSISIRLEIPTHGFFASRRSTYNIDESESPRYSLFSFLGLNEQSVSKALVSKSGFVIDADQSFSKLVDLRDGIFLVGGKVALSDKVENRRLYDAIYRIASSDTKVQEELVRVTSRAYGKFYVCNVSAPEPLAWTSRSRISGVAVISIIDPMQESPIQSKHLEHLFDLTPSEARVAVGIVTGKEISEIAIQHGVAVGTVRNQLKSVFQKVGVSRQSELVRVILRISRVISASA